MCFEGDGKSSLIVFGLKGFCQGVYPQMFLLDMQIGWLQDLMNFCLRHFIF